MPASPTLQWTSLIQMVTAAPNREDQVAAVKALDRVLLANHFVVPMFYSGEARIAYWNRIVHPQRLPEYSIGFPDTWSAKNAAK